MPWFTYSDNTVRYRITTNVPAPTKAVRPMENRPPQELNLISAQVESPALFICHAVALANWQQTSEGRSLSRAPLTGRCL